MSRKMSRKKYREIAEKYCAENDLILIGVDTVLKGNRLEISVGRQGYVNKNGQLITKSVIIGCGKQDVDCEGYVYTVIRNDNDIGTDGISLFHFKSISDARSWIRQDIDMTLASIDILIKREDLFVGKDCWSYDDCDSHHIDWSIRRLPLQDNDTWTDPEYPVNYRVVKGN